MEKNIITVHIKKPVRYVTSAQRVRGKKLKVLSEVVSIGETLIIEWVGMRTNSRLCRMFFAPIAWQGALSFPYCLVHFYQRICKSSLWVKRKNEIEK